MLNDYVVAQFRFAEISARALVATKGCNAGVGPHVRVRVVLLGEGAGAHTTLERFFTCMRPHVPHHAVGVYGRVRTQGAKLERSLRG